MLKTRFFNSRQFRVILKSDQFNGTVISPVTSETTFPENTNFFWDNNRWRKTAVHNKARPKGEEMPHDGRSELRDCHREWKGP
jgi:hypothetical protein